MKRGIVVASLALAIVAPGQKAGAKKKADKDELTLKRLFPDKKPLFGPSARGAEFGHDGRYAVYQWRAYHERRHGADLWLVDVRAGKSTRLTSAAKFAEYLESARKVAEHREKQAKAKLKGNALKKAQAAGLGDWVSDDDGEDEKAPRWSGVGSIEWAPSANELLFTVGGDVFRYVVDSKKLSRLTQTRQSERDVQYLPDGKGYTYLSGDALMKVQFGSHLVVQLNPKIDAGESLGGYKLGPDGKLLVLTGRKGGSWMTGASRRVNIATYRDRFMKVNQVPRVVSDDPRAETFTSVYVYSLPELMRDNGGPKKVHTHKHTGPRDFVASPDWSPDGKKITFASFTQDTELMQVFTADAAKAAAQKDEPKSKSKDETDADKKGEAGEKKGDKADAKTAKAKPAVKAKEVFRYLHTGGPNTPNMIRPRFLADSRHIALMTEVSGFRHLHVLDPLYESLTQITRGRHETYAVDMSKDRNRYYVTATKEHASQTDVYCVNLPGGEMRRLSRHKGSYSSVAVSPNGKHLLANFSAYGRLRELVLLAAANGRQSDLTSSHPASTAELCKPKPEFFSFLNRHGHDIHGLLFKPDGWTKRGKRPLLVYVYGGPLGTRKHVTQGNYSSDVYLFAYYMAKKHGYVTCTIDPRGMSGYGAAFEKANFEQVGKPQVEDLVDGVKHLVANYGVDAKRVGIHGWSFGGFQTQMCLYTAPEVFAVGMAGAGPTEWENYNQWYSTATIGKTREGKADLKKYSLLPLAKNLKGQLLLVHGMEDSNVLYQDTVRVYRELLKAGKETHVELFLDPTGGHGLGGDVKRLNRARKYEDFLLRHLGNGKVGARRLTVKGN